MNTLATVFAHSLDKSRLRCAGKGADDLGRDLGRDHGRDLARDCARDDGRNRARENGRGRAGFRITVLLAGCALALSAGLLPVDLSAAVSGSAVSDDESRPAQRAGDARAVRLSSVEGQVQVVQDGQVIADPATANLPLFEGTQVITGNEGRAEIQLDDGNLARLSPNTTITLTLLQREGTGTKTDVVLNGGLAYFELQPSNAEHSLRVNYGSASFAASSFTVVRLTLDEPPGELAVFSGNIHLESGDTLQVDVHGGESLVLNPTDRVGYDLGENISQNSWDSWNADRDQLLNAEADNKTAATAGTGINNQGPGMGDLDANGNWYNVPGQGYVWSPYDAQSAGMDWDPYGYGSWVSYPGYGYIWASGYGWGYAPYQCGLWNYYDSFGWAWAPGRNGCRPWYGTGSGWGYNLGNAPRGYKPPRRPGPVHPRPVRGPAGHERLTSAPAVPVDRRSPGTTGLAFNGRPAQPVTIAGHVVEPLGPIAPRPTYDRTTTSFVNTERNGTEGRPGTIYVPGGAHPGYYPGPSGRQGQPGYPVSRPSGGDQGRQSQAQSFRPAPVGGSGNSGSRGSSPAPSGGNMGGGGGSHASGGGGSPGGGGGTHK